MDSSVELLTPFNFHSWKGDMEIQLRAEFPSYSTEYLDDEIGGDNPDLDPLISNISV